MLYSSDFTKGTTQPFGTSGIFLVIIIFIAMIMIGLFHPAAAIILGLFGVILSVMMGFIEISGTILVGIIAVGIIIAIKARN